MDEYDKLNIRLVKEKLTKILESGQIKEPQVQYDLVHEALREINLIKDERISSSISKYFIDQELLGKQIEDEQKSMQKLMDEYGDNVKEIYEMVKKL